MHQERHEKYILVTSCKFMSKLPDKLMRCGFGTEESCWKKETRQSCGTRSLCCKKMRIGRGCSKRTLRRTVFTKALDLKNPHSNDAFITSKFLNVRCCQHTTIAVIVTTMKLLANFQKICTIDKTQQDVVAWSVQLCGSRVGFQPPQFAVKIIQMFQVEGTHKPLIVQCSQRNPQYSGQPCTKSLSPKHT